MSKEKEPYSKRTPVEFLQENWVIILFAGLFLLMCTVPMLFYNVTRPYVSGMLAVIVVVGAFIFIVPYFQGKD